MRTSAAALRWTASPHHRHHCAARLLDDRLVRQQQHRPLDAGSPRSGRIIMHGGRINTMQPRESITAANGGGSRSQHRDVHPQPDELATSGRTATPSASDSTAVGTSRASAVRAPPHRRPNARAVDTPMLCELRTASRSPFIVALFRRLQLVTTDSLPRLSAAFASHGLPLSVFCPASTGGCFPASEPQAGLIVERLGPLEHGHDPGRAIPHFGA